MQINKYNNKITEASIIQELIELINVLVESSFREKVSI
jgi:hypothetical protein